MFFIPRFAESTSVYNSICPALLFIHSHRRTHTRRIADAPLLYAADSRAGESADCRPALTPSLFSFSVFFSDGNLFEPGWYIERVRAAGNVRVYRACESWRGEVIGHSDENEYDWSEQLRSRPEWSSGRLRRGGTAHHHHHRHGSTKMSL